MQTYGNFFYAVNNVHHSDYNHDFFFHSFIDIRAPLALYW